MYYSLYDRKSNRHNWQIIGTTDNIDRLDFLSAHYQRIAASCIGWEGYQQKVVDSLEYDHDSTLPRNDRQGKIL